MTSSLAVSHLTAKQGSLRSIRGRLAASLGIRELQKVEPPLSRPPSVKQPQ